MTEQLALLIQPQINVTTIERKDLILAVEADIDGQPMRWQFLAVHDGEGWHVYVSHSNPDNEWTGCIRLPRGRRPIPTDLMELHAYTRWYLGPRIGAS